MDSQQTAARIDQQVSSYLSDFAGQAEPHSEVLSGKRADSPVLKHLVTSIQTGSAKLHDLARGYKHTPHAPPALLFKYIVHRTNHIDKYDSKATGAVMDEEFFREQGRGAARAQHMQVTPRHLNHWLKLNPTLVPEALAHRDALHTAVLRNIGLNVRNINSEPHVAMTRGLDDNQMKNEMALSSFGDVEDTGFGGYQHHAWMPLKDLWYGFPSAPKNVGGEHGHENEWLFSNSLPRYEARKIDVTPSIFQKAYPGEIDLHNADMTNDADIAAGIAEGRLTREHAMTLSDLGRLGPLTLQAALGAGLDKGSVVGDKLIPREVAMQVFHTSAAGGDGRWSRALENPNLTAEDLEDAMTEFPKLTGIGPTRLQRATSKIVGHPNTSEKVLAKLVDYALRSGYTAALLPVIAKNAKIPSIALHRALIEGLDQSASWMPSRTIAKCFANSTLQSGESAREQATNVPTAFNNSENSEKYLRALASYFKEDQDGDAARSAYHGMLCGARLNDTTTNTLIDMALSGHNLPGLTPEEHREVLGEAARFNNHLSNRQLIRFAKFQEGIEGILNRHAGGGLSPVLQQAIVENLDFGDGLSPSQRWQTSFVSLATRSDLHPDVADTMLKRIDGLPEYGVFGQKWMIGQVAFSIASNPLIPIDRIKKHLQNDQTWFDQRLQEGLRMRGAYEHMLLPVPAGGIE